jgi:acetyl esterase
MSAPFLTPSTERLLQQVAAGPAPDPSVASQRQALEGAMAALGWPAPPSMPEPLGLPGGASIFRFAPQAGDPRPLRIVYCHGGSFIAGGARPHSGIAQALATAAGAEVALVDYRLAPEHPLPAGRDDCIEAALRLAREGPIVLIGDSAGGWLAVETALALATQAPGAVRRLVLVNPMIGSGAAPEGSKRDFATGYFASASDFADAWRLAGPWASTRIQPGGEDGDYSVLPPTIVITNEADPVRDEGEAFAELLSHHGVDVLSLRARGVIHAAWLFPAALPEAHLLLDVVAGAIGAHPPVKT